MRQSTTTTSLMAVVLLLVSGTANVYAAPTSGDSKPKIEVRQANTLTANPNFDEPWEIPPSEQSRDDAANALKKAGGKRSPDPDFFSRFEGPWTTSGARHEAAKAIKKAGGKRSPAPEAAIGGKFDEGWLISGSREKAASALKNAASGK